MSFFKFECPHCHSRMEVSDDHLGMEIDCPHCSKHVKIEHPKEDAVKEEADDKKVEEQPKDEVANKEGASEESQEPEDTQISYLTTELKIEFLKEVSAMISDQSKWLPGRNAAGKLQMAAKGTSDNPTVVAPESGEAEIYSIIGAFIKVMADRKVLMTASGRSRLLSEEIPTAAGKVKKGDSPKTDPMTLDHSECLQTLDVMTKTYGGMIEQREEATKPKAGESDALKKLMNLDGEIDPREIIHGIVPVVRDLQDRVKKLEEALKASE